MTPHNYNKVALLPLRDALRTGNHNSAKELFFDLMDKDVSIKINTPFQALNSVGMLWGKNNDEDQVLEDMIDIYVQLDINVFDRRTKMLNGKDAV